MATKQRRVSMRLETRAANLRVDGSVVIRQPTKAHGSPNQWWFDLEARLRDLGFVDGARDVSPGGEGAFSATPFRVEPASSGPNDVRYDLWCGSRHLGTLGVSEAMAAEIAQALNATGSAGDPL